MRENVPSSHDSTAESRDSHGYVGSIFKTRAQTLAIRSSRSPGCTTPRSRWRVVGANFKKAKTKTVTQMGEMYTCRGKCVENKAGKFSGNFHSFSFWLFPEIDRFRA